MSSRFCDACVVEWFAVDFRGKGNNSLRMTLRESPASNPDHILSQGREVQHCIWRCSFDRS